MLRFLSGGLLALVVLVVAGCGSATSTHDDPSVAISAEPTTATVEVGDQLPVSVTITRNGGFSGAVTITVEGTPAGVTATPNAPSTSGATSVVTISVGEEAAVGSYSLTIRAKGANVSDATTPLTLTIVPAANSHYLLRVDNAPLNVIQGNQVSTTIGITRVGGFQEPITFSAEQLPTGATATFNPNPAPGLGSALTVTVGATVTPATYPMRIRGTVTGRTDVTANLSLVVSAAPSFTIAVGAATINLVQGKNGSTFVKGTRSAGFTSPATYTVTGAPAGMTATLTQTSVTDSLVLAVATTAGLAVGRYSLVVHASANGVPDQTASLDVIVASAAGVDVVLDFTVCPADAILPPPTWVAYQDGAGPWTPVAAAGGIYRFHIAEATGGLAMVRQKLGQSVTTTVDYLTQAELRDSRATCQTAVSGLSSLSSGSNTLNGTLASLDPADYAQIVMGGGTAGGGFGITGPTTAFQLSNVRDGVQDLFAHRAALDGTESHERMVIRRDLNIPNGGTIAALDFDGAEAFQPATGDFPITGGTPNGPGIGVDLNLIAGGGCEANTFLLGSGSQGSVRVFGIPTDRLRAGDAHMVTVTDDGNFTGARRIVQAIFHEFAPRTLALGATMPQTATIASVTGAYSRIKAVFAVPSDYRTAGLYYHDGLGHFFVVTATDGYRGQATATLTAPDFGGVAGYNVGAWAPTQAPQIKVFGRSSTATVECGEGTTIYGDQIVAAH